MQFVIAHAVSSYSISAERRIEPNKVTHDINDNHHFVDSKSNNDDGETIYVIAFNEEKEIVEKEKNTDDGKNIDCFYS